ncbi:helix-turn-helix domain-containing protein [Streptomyces sp. NPDC059679]|uniref:helix-turn-helix domain-containing protein n=1 Tax=Streptomyces sp. NPDC059679 TaxID=3346903 RepID=UPI0036AB50A1
MEVDRKMMDGPGAGTDGSRGMFSLDSTIPGAVPRGVDTFRYEWETQVGAAFPLPNFSPATAGDLRAKTRVAKLRDAVIADIHLASPLRTATPPGGGEDQVLLYAVGGGAWTLGELPDRGEHTVSAGQFLFRHVGQPLHFETAPHTTAELLVLPTPLFRPLLGNRSIIGPTDTAEIRLLTAHANMIHTAIADLSPAGVHAAHSTLIELAKAVVRRRFDDVEPLLAPALTQAAKDLVNSHLADSELSPRMLARELNVSVRTLQRAFAVVGESVTAYIRHRRLEEARLALIAPSGRLSVSELAAHWQFADTSHFTRAFKKRYGRTPTEYARSVGTQPRRTPAHPNLPSPPAS